jgi:hypothetical protein
MRNANRRFVLKARPEGIAGPAHFTEDAVAVRSPESGWCCSNGAKTVVTEGDPVVLLDPQSAGLLATMREAI